MKNILLLVHDDCGQEARFQAALDATRALQGHLTCLDVTAMQVLPGDGFAVEAGAMLLEDERVREGANRQRLEQRLAAEDVPWDWIDVTGFLEPCIEEAARMADLIIVNRRLDEFPVPDMLAVAADLIVRSGKPVLAVPDRIERLDTAGAALVAWDGSDAASAAVRAAVPLLRLAGAVAIVEVDDGSVRVPAEEAAAYLSRHDIHADILRCEGEAGERILAETRRGRFAYVVMGGFGHGRFRELLFGGVTRKLLCESPVPLFLAR